TQFYDFYSNYFIDNPLETNIEDAYYFSINRFGEGYLSFALSTRAYSGDTRTPMRFFVEGSLGGRYQIMRSVQRPYHPKEYVNEKLGLRASFGYQYKPLTVFFFPSAFDPQLPLEDIFNIGVDQKRDHFLLLDLSGRYYSDGTRSRTRFFVEGGGGLRHHFMQAIGKPLHPDPMIREQVIRGFNLSLSLGIPTWVLSAHVSGGFQYAFSRKWGLEMAALGRFIHRSPFQLGIQLTIVRFIQDR
ncbi:MAG: hypothetical protein AAFQ83_25710, partial [Bacteroidota bacterium]